MDGFSTLDLAALPLPARVLLRLMLRKPRISYDELRQAVAELPDEQRFSVEELDSALTALCEKTWMVRTEENGQVIYAVNVRKKTGTQDLSSKVRATQLLQKIEGITNPADSATPPPEQSTKTTTSEPTSDTPAEDNPKPRVNPLDKLLGFGRKKDG